MAFGHVAICDIKILLRSLISIYSFVFELALDLARSLLYTHIANKNREKKMNPKKYVYYRPYFPAAPSKGIPPPAFFKRRAKR